MIIYKNEFWAIVKQSWDKPIAQSLYDQSTITYPVEKVIYQTKKETKVDKVIDADGKEVILRTYEVETPILDEKWNPIIKEKVREIVRYNHYDVEWYTPINDEYTIITEEEYNKLLQEQQAKLQAQG